MCGLAGLSEVGLFKRRLSDLNPPDYVFFPLFSASILLGLHFFSCVLVQTGRPKPFVLGTLHF